METTEKKQEKRKGYLLIVIGIFVVGITVAILLTIYNQNLIEKRGKSNIIQPGTEEAAE